MTLPKALVLSGDWYAERVAEGRDVGPVFRLELIPGMEPHEPLRADAVDSPPCDLTFARKGIGRIDLAVFWRPVDAVASGIRSNHMEIDLMTAGIGEREVPRPRVVTGNISITPAPKRPHSPCEIHLVDHDVEISVRPRLSPEASVDRPAPIDPNVHPKRIELAQESEHILARRFGHRTIITRPARDLWRVEGA